jgi:uncharacterized OB-fold protein
MCPRCGSVDWQLADLAGTGSVYSWIVSRHPTQPDSEARIVALIEFDEGIRMVSNLRDIAVRPALSCANLRWGNWLLFQAERAA